MSVEELEKKRAELDRLIEAEKKAAELAHMQKSVGRCFHFVTEPRYPEKDGQDVFYKITGVRYGQYEAVECRTGGNGHTAIRTFIDYWRGPVEDEISEEYFLQKWNEVKDSLDAMIAGAPPTQKAPAD